jgi:hypothetical protein
MLPSIPIFPPEDPPKDSFDWDGDDGGRTVSTGDSTSMDYPVFNR